MQPWLVPLIVGLAVPILGFLGVAYKLSGRIARSDAADLWAEARAMRDEWRQRALVSEEALRTCHRELQELRHDRTA